MLQIVLDYLREYIIHREDRLICGFNVHNSDFTLMLSGGSSKVKSMYLSHRLFGSRARI